MQIWDSYYRLPDFIFNLNLMKKVYIIGNIPKVIDECCELKFYGAQMSLFQRGFSVVNPIERLSDTNIDYKDALKKNLQDLIMCDAVYILPCVNLAEGKKNLEVMYALNFNLLIFHGVLDLTTDISNVPENSTKTKNKVLDVNSNI